MTDTILMTRVTDQQLLPDSILVGSKTVARSKMTLLREVMTHDMRVLPNCIYFFYFPLFPLFYFFTILVLSCVMCHKVVEKNRSRKNRSRIDFIRAVTSASISRHDLAISSEVR